MKFACPSCQQHIEADDGYAGMQISCPTCRAQMIVPGTPAAPAPPAPVSAPPSYNPHPQGGLRTHTPAQTPASSAPRPGYQAAAPRQMPVPSGQPKWYANPMIYLGIIVLVFLGMIGMVMAGNKVMVLPLAVCFLLYILTVYIWVAIVAFKEGVGHGIGCLVCGLYSLYFVYKQDTSSTLKAYYSVILLFGLGARILSAILKN